MALELVETISKESSEKSSNLIDQIVGIIGKNKEYKDPPFRYADNEQEFAIAHEAREIGRNLIRRHYHLLAEMEPRIEYVFLKNTPVKSGKETLGRAKKISSLNAWLAMDVSDRENKTLPAPFFVIELSWEIWRRLPLAKRVALVDHELAHCGYNDKAKPAMQPHDCEEFSAIVARHGMWSNDIRELVDAARQSEKNPLYAAQINAETGETEDVEF